MWLVRSSSPKVISAMSSVAAQSQTWAQLRWSRLRTIVARPAAPAAVSTIGHSRNSTTTAASAASFSATRGRPSSPLRARGIHRSSKSAAAGSGRAARHRPPLHGIGIRYHRARISS
jgi:hypothetical protein